MPYVARDRHPTRCFPLPHSPPLLQHFPALPAPLQVLRTSLTTKLPITCDAT
ncbi:hypothetical protein C8Q76DRAFT_762829 [Earliella scabrosa]|nr:hypothetical protein C8Q76DRAFT_762829 [Earliella scabrosa]